MNFFRKNLKNEFILPVPKYNPIFLQNKIGLHGKAVIFIVYKVQSCTYYKSGSLKSMTDASGKTLFYEYNNEGRLKTLKDASNEILTEYRYTMGEESKI